MKRVTVGFKREEFGFVEIEVPDDASEDDIVDAAHEAESDGICNWADEETTCTGVIDETIIEEE